MKLPSQFWWSWEVPDEKFELPFFLLNLPFFPHLSAPPDLLRPALLPPLFLPLLLL